MFKILQSVKSLRHIRLNGSSFTLVLALISQILRANPEQIIAGIDGRIDQVFQAESGDSFKLAKVQAPLDAGRPYYARAYSWSVVGYAARCFRLNESLPAANARLQQNARYYMRQLTAADITEILPTSGGNTVPENNTSTYSRIVDRDSFHWHADITLRLIEMYGTNGSVAAGRMDPTTEAKCLEPIWHYVRLVSRLEKAEITNSKTWHLWESENHFAQCFSIAWHFSKIAKDHPDYKDRTYTDVNGIVTTPAALYAAWNAYFVEYVRERFRKGLFVEMMSQGYNSESIRGIYNFYDFGDAEVQRYAGMYLDLFWTYWAQEQFDDVLGGGMSRRTLSGTLNVGHGGLTSNMANLYFGLGLVPNVDGHSVNPLLSAYRPKPVIADIAVDVAGRGTYEVRQRAQGLGQAGTTNWDQSRDLNPYRLNANGGGIVRYSYCTPSFIMGTPMYDHRPLNDWVAISSQGRQQSVIFSGAAEAARIVPCVLPPDERYTRNGFWTVQSKGSMITQILNTSDGANEMWAWISKAGLSDPVLDSGIYFVETDEANGAYAAIRTTPGSSFTLIENRPLNTFTPPAHWIVELNDKTKPLILEVMAKDQVASFADFKALVKSKTPTLSSGLVTYNTIYGETLTLDTTYNNPPTINTVPVNYSPGKSYDSPFLSGNYNGETFLIKKGSRQEEYTFAPSPSVTDFSPADDSTAVAINTDLSVTFNQNVSIGTGLIALKNLTDGTQISIDITDGTQVSISGATLTINPTSNLLESKAYAVQIASGAIENTSGALFAGITDDTTWNFTTVGPPDTTPPLLNMLNPADDSSGVDVNSNLVLTFNEDVMAGNGMITLKKTGDDSTVETFAVGSSPQVSFVGAQLIIDPTTTLDFLASYYVLIESTAVKDVSGNSFAGLTASTDWNFRTSRAVITVLGTDSFPDTATGDNISTI